MGELKKDGTNLHWHKTLPLGPHQTKNRFDNFMMILIQTSNSESNFILFLPNLHRMLYPIPPNSRGSVRNVTAQEQLLYENIAKNENNQNICLINYGLVKNLNYSFKKITIPCL